MASSFDRIPRSGTIIPQNSSFARTGIGMPSLSPNLSTSEGLLQLGLSQGGAIGQASYEMAHPTVGILSTIGTNLKKAFGNFVDLISVPSQVIAGIISPDLTVKDAITKNVSVSDVVFGEKDPNASIYKKTGSFLARTAVDILTDPLTYVTFGAGSGLLGLRTGTQIALGERAAQQAGKEFLEYATLNKSGQELYTMLAKTANQMAGDTKASIVKTGDETIDMAGKELDQLLKASIDSPLRPDFAKQALSNLLEKKPELVETFLDKGGVKLFNQSILSGQRINSTLRLIPGMTKLDEITLQPRLAIQSLFNPAVVKSAGVGGKYVRIPQGYLDLEQQFLDLGIATTESKIKSLDDLRKQFDVTETEAKFLLASMEHMRMPSNPKLAQAYKALRGFDDAEWNDLVKAGRVSEQSRIEGHVPHILVTNKVGPIPFKLPPSAKVDAAQIRQVARFTDQATGKSITGHAGSMGLKPTADKNIFTNEKGDLFTRDIEPIHEISAEAFNDIEKTLLKDQKKAAEMLGEMKQQGFTGFDDNIITALASRSINNSKSVTMAYFLRELAKNFGHNAEAAKDGLVRISSNALSKEAENLVQFMGRDGDIMFHPAIAARVEKFMGAVINDEPINDFLKAYDSLQNAWKATVTSIWPAFHGRNAISNVLQNYLDMGVHALNPKIHTLSINTIAKNRQISNLQNKALKGDTKAAAQVAEILEEEAFTDATGYKWSFGELRQVVKNNNIAFTQKVVTSADIQKGPEGLVEAMFPAPGVKSKTARAIKAPFKFGQDVVGRTIEEHARLTNFIANLRNTGDVTLATKRTKQFLFDYGALTNFEKQFMRRIIPFYTFTRKNLELQARTLLKTPGRIASEVHGIQTLGEVISGGDQLSEEEKNALPDWIKAGVSILTKKNGDQISLIANLGTPLEQPFQQFQGNVLLGSISPLLRVPVEQMAGYSFFQGKPLSEVTNATAFSSPLVPQFVKDFIGYTKIDGKRSDGTPFTWHVALNPERMNLLLNLPPTTRVYTALKQMNAADVSDQAKIIQQLTGIKPYSFDLEQERRKRENELKDKLEDLLTKAGITAKYETTYIPKDKKAEIIRQYQQAF